jgi:hypothetical protein
MKLGIAVVYLVGERNEPLLDLHLGQIEKHTQIPFTIYAAVNRLLPQFREKLARHPHVKICDCQTYQEGSGLWRHDAAKAATQGLAAVGSKYEHSFYLEQLIRAAIEDGVTHVSMLHVDSFPIRSGWAVELAGKLSDRCVLAAITRDEKTDYKPLTACILYHRDFYLKYQPRLLLSQEQFDSADYKRYCQAQPHVTDSGFGYGFKMFMEGLTWYPLLKSNKGGNHAQFASVHGDLIFHLHAAAFVESTRTVGFTKSTQERRGVGKLVVRLARALLPPALRQRVRKTLPQRIRDPQEYVDRQAWERERQRLFDDPEGYLDYLRTGRGRLD